MSNTDDVRLTAQLVAGRKVHCVSDASVEALARRVLELEGAVADEREACAIAGAAAVRHSQQTTDQCRAAVAAAIRARSRKVSP